MGKNDLGMQRNPDISNSSHTQVPLKPQKLIQRTYKKRWKHLNNLNPIYVLIYRKQELFTKRMKHCKLKNGSQFSKQYMRGFETLLAEKSPKVTGIKSDKIKTKALSHQKLFSCVLLLNFHCVAIVTCKRSETLLKHSACHFFRRNHCKSESADPTFT